MKNLIHVICRLFTGWTLFKCMYFVGIALWECRFKAINMHKTLKKILVGFVCKAKSNSRGFIQSETRLHLNMNALVTNLKHTHTHTHIEIIKHFQSIFVSLHFPMSQMKAPLTIYVRDVMSRLQFIQNVHVKIQMFSCIVYEAYLARVYRWMDAIIQILRSF